LARPPASTTMRQTRIPSTPRLLSSPSYLGGNRCPMSGTRTISLKPRCFSQATRA
jgi:hypothetical protein